MIFFPCEGNDCNWTEEQRIQWSLQIMRMETNYMLESCNKKGFALSMKVLWSFERIDQWFCNHIRMSHAISIERYGFCTIDWNCWRPGKFVQIFRTKTKLIIYYLFSWNHEQSNSCSCEPFEFENQNRILWIVNDI